MAWPPGRRPFPPRAISNRRAREAFWLPFRVRLRSPSGHRKSRRWHAIARCARARDATARDCSREPEPERDPPELPREWLRYGRSGGAPNHEDFSRKSLAPSRSNPCPAKPDERKTTRQEGNPESRRQSHSPPGKKGEGPRAFLRPCLRHVLPQGPKPRLRQERNPLWERKSRS